MNRVHDLLVYGDAGYFFFLDASTGSLVDTIDLLEIRYTRGAIPGYPSVDESEQKVFLPFGYGAEDADRGGILCYDAVNREVLWDFQVPPLFLLWGTDLKEADSYANAVAYESGELYVSAAKQVFRLSVEDQQIAWADTLPRTIYWPLSGISISGEETFTETNAGEVLAHGKTDGELSWSVVPSGATLTGRMELIDEELYMFSSGDLIILDSGSGVTRWIGRPGNIADVDKDIGFYSKVSLTDTTFAILGTDGIYCVYRPGRAPDPE